MDGRCGSKHMHEANAVRVASAVSHASFETWPSEVMIKGKLYACVFEKLGLFLYRGSGRMLMCSSMELSDGWA
jgi:hypothetical protein